MMGAPLAIAPHSSLQSPRFPSAQESAAATTTTTQRAPDALPSLRRGGNNMASHSSAPPATAGGGGGASADGNLVKLEVYMDLLCPYCFIAKHSLEEVTGKYAREHPGAQFQITYMPYFISSALKPIAKRDLYERAFSNLPRFLERIQSAGTKHDIAFSLRGRTGNSRQAHKLVALALQERGPQGQAIALEQLFQGHFEDGRDITDESWLVSVGAAAGIREEIVRLELEDEDAARRVDGLAAAAREVIGVEAVPCVMVQGKYKVGGLQEGEVFESLFEKMRLAGEIACR